MNREIKFRVWAGKSFLHSYKGRGLAFSASRRDSDMESFGCYDLEQCLDFGFIIQQFTGLVDKNGKEIYEGDIFKSSGEYLWDKIEFQDGKFVANLRGARSFDLGELCSNTERWKPEVGGNIFENPELLK